MKELIMKELIKIELVPEIDFATNMIVKVMDFPSGESGPARQRCKITVEYGESDVTILKDKGMDKIGALEYYQNWVYNVVRINISQDWQCVGGMDEVMQTIEEHITQYFD